MECKKIQGMIRSYINDELNADEAEAFIKHIEACNTCMEELEIYYIIKHGLNSDFNLKGFDIEKALNEKLKSSKNYIKKIKLLKIFYYALNSLLVIGTLVTILLQFRIWWQGGYFK